MNLTEIKELVQSDAYSFLRDDKHLGENIILLGLGGSHAYGTNIETSDLDVRGITLNSKEDILASNNFEQVVDEATDTTVYSFMKMMYMLCNSNPNTIEILGLKKEHYLYLSPIGRELLDNREMFISQECIASFGGYANQQLYRLNQKSTHAQSQANLEKHILKTAKFMESTLARGVYPLSYEFVEPDHGDIFLPSNVISEQTLRLYIDKSQQKDMDTEIYMDINASHYPLRDYCNIWGMLQNLVKSYRKVGERNNKAIEHGKISKHAMHLLRLHLMCIDMLEGRGIITYREKDHDLLMSIRNGKYTRDDNSMTPEFFELLDDITAKLEEAKKNTNIPKKPDYKRINEFTMNVNERVVRGEI